MRVDYKEAAAGPARRDVQQTRHHPLLRARALAALLLEWLRAREQYGYLLSAGEPEPAYYKVRKSTSRDLIVKEKDE